MTKQTRTLLENARIALSFYRNLLPDLRNAKGERIAYPSGEQREEEIRKALAEHETAAPVTLAELVELFPSLRPFDVDSKAAPDVAARDLETRLHAAGCGSGAAAAAQFVCSVFDIRRSFATSAALARWDSAHRAAWAAACDMIARRGL